jgi:hypothetical protein
MNRFIIGRLQTLLACAALAMAGCALDEGGADESAGELQGSSTHTKSATVKTAGIHGGTTNAAPETTSFDVHPEDGPFPEPWTSGPFPEPWNSTTSTSSSTTTSSNGTTSSTTTTTTTSNGGTGKPK